jgi:uncharacterized protein YaaN involved in tellurite resistance
MTYDPGVRTRPLEGHDTEEDDVSDSLNIDKAPAKPSATAPAGPAPAADAPPAEEESTSTALVLVPPAPVAVVPADKAASAVKLDPATTSRLDDVAASYLETIARLDDRDPAFASKVNEIDKLGDEDIKASASVSSRLLDKPVSAMQRGGLSQTSTVSSSLIQLRKQVQDLDPAHQGDLTSPHKLLGLIPFGDRLRTYFGKYQSSQSHINAVIHALENGQGELRKDNADIEQEKANLWAVMERLRQYIYLGQKLDAGLSARIDQVAATDPDRARVLREDMLFPVRQKVQDLMTQLAVSVQGYMALDVIRHNNVELIRGVDRATTTTVSALRTAVIVAQALADQKLVLDQITALNTTTSNLIESTSVLLRQQSTAVNEQAASATVDLAKLQAAFDNIYATMDEIDTFKLKALDSMSKTVDALSAEVQKSQTYLDRARARDATPATEATKD